MSLAPLINASFAIQLHTAAAILAAVTGLTVMARAKGTLTHRAVGYVFTATIIVTAISSFWIMGLNHGRYSWIHILSVVTLISVPLAIYHRRTGNIRGHAANMIGTFIGLVIAGAFTFLPGRIMHAVFWVP